MRKSWYVKFFTTWNTEGKKVKVYRVLQDPNNIAKKSDLNINK